MRLMRNMATLLAVTGNAVSTDQTGSIYRIETSAEDGTKDTEQTYQVYFKLSQAGGATSPTTKVKLQTSPDKTSWVDVVESTQLTADGSKTELKDVSGAPLLPFVRAVTVLGGATKPNHTCEVRLVSDGSFRARLQS